MYDEDRVTTTGQYYKPKNKKERAARQRIFDRYRAMRDDSLRKEKELEWEMADKAFTQWMPDRALGDWRSHIVLPDSFAAVQSHMQETVDRKSRPKVELSEDADLAREMFANSIMKSNMDRTGYDFQQYLSKQCAAIRGTSFRREYYRLDKREVQDLIDVNDDGSLEYEKKEITDFDDTYNEHLENEQVYLDPGAKHQDSLRDWVYREVLDWKEFQRVYGGKSDFINVNLVPKAGIISDQVKYFERVKDMTDDDVEVLHYENRATDSYDVLANNVLVRLGPLPYKHKELTIAIDTHYHIPGSIYGMGIPKIIYSLTEERTTFRRMSSDRQRMQIDKMFLVNDLVDLDEEDVRTRPHGFIPINTNGLRLDQVIEPLEYGDIPPSYYQIEKMLLDDIVRAHGIIPSLDTQRAGGGTATEAAIAQQTAQKRIQLINTIAEMDTIVRIGKLKWSNIQFFYPAPRVQIITEGDKTRTVKSFRTVKVQGQEFEIRKDPGTGKTALAVNDIDGASGFKLNPKFAKFMDGDWEVTIAAEAGSSLPKPIHQAKITEMFNVLVLNPQLMSAIDPKKAVKRYLTINDEDPKDWMRDEGLTDVDWKRLAIHENLVMSTGQVLSATENAPTAHTEEHLNFVNSKDYDTMPDAVKMVFQEHILGEHQANPNTGDVAAIMPPGVDQSGLAGGAGAEGNVPTSGGTTQTQPVDIQPGGVGADQRDTQQSNVPNPNTPLAPNA